MRGEGGSAGLPGRALEMDAYGQLVRPVLGIDGEFAAPAPAATYTAFVPLASLPTPGGRASRVNRAARGGCAALDPRPLGVVQVDCGEGGRSRLRKEDHLPPPTHPLS